MVNGETGAPDGVPVGWSDPWAGIVSEEVAQVRQHNFLKMCFGPVIKVLDEASPAGLTRERVCRAAQRAKAFLKLA